MIRSVNAAGGGIDLLRQFVGVGRFEFRHAAIFQDQFGQRVVRGQLLEDILRGRRLSGRRLARHRDAELAEQDFLELLRRIHIELTAGFRVRLEFQLVHADGELFAVVAQQVPVDEDPGPLHAVEHRDEGLLDRFI